VKFENGPCVGELRGEVDGHGAAVEGYFRERHFWVRVVWRWDGAKVKVKVEVQG
jgi:hypothetical protein